MVAGDSRLGVLAGVLTSWAEAPVVTGRGGVDGEDEKDGEDVRRYLPSRPS